MKKVYVFLALTFALSILSHGLLAILTRMDIIDFDSAAGMILFIIGGASPTVWAFVVAHRFGASEKQAFYDDLLNWRSAPRYWIYALVIPIAAALILRSMIATMDPEVAMSVETVWFYPLYLLSAIVFGGLEEVGWRGMLQRHLKPRLTLIKTAAIIGVIWGVWHTPLFFVDGGPQEGYAYVPYIMSALFFSGFITYLYARTRSILLVVLFHAGINAAASIGLYIPMKHTSSVYLTLTLGIAAVYALIYAQDRNLIV